VINEFNSLDYARKRNKPGALQLIMPTKALGIGITPVRDGRLEVFRSAGASTPYLDMDTVWFIESWTQKSDDDTFIINAIDTIGILSRRLIAYYTGKAKTDKKKVVETVLKEIVNENFGASATAVRNISAYLNVEADTGKGPIVHEVCGWKYVLDALQDACDMAENKGSYFSFDITKKSDTVLEFRTYENQRGVNRGQSSDNSLTVSDVNGSLSDAELTVDYSEEHNFIYVGGKGEGSNRAKATSEDASRSTISPYSRCEYFLEANNTTKKTALQDKGYKQLNKSRPIMKLTGKIIETKNTLYGVHYNYGDIVIAQYKNTKFDAHVDNIRVQVSGKSETVTSNLEGEISV
jgi:hypothetical protein